tara:strand:+ start:1029 stop:1964 length:936 start_codon:yes stop_codon:yes gene_type:complete
MNLSYGIAKTGGVGANDWAFDTDLGIATNSQTNLSITPQKGMVKTTDTLVAGSGYSVGLGDIRCSSTGGSGTGAIFTCRTGYGGALVVDRSLFFKNDPFNNSITIRVTATGDPITGSTTAITGVSANGTTATFILSSTNGVINKCSVVALGTGYIEGEIISFTKVAIEAGYGAGNVTSLPAGGVLKVVLQSGDVSGSIIQIVSVEGGSGYTIGDTLTLQEIGSSTTGTATVEVLTLDLGQSLISSPNNTYPKAVRVTEGTVAAPKTIEFVGIDDVNVTIGGFIAGTIFPFNFKEIAAAGSNVTLTSTTILY